jgi:hypothetical protein
MGLVSGVLMVVGLAWTLGRWRQGYNVLLLCAWFMLIAPAALAMLPRDSPGSLRLSGTLGVAVLLAALPLHLLIELAEQLVSHRKTAPAQPAGAAADAATEERPRVTLTLSSPARQYAWSWQPRLGLVWLCIVVVVASGLLLYESREAERFYFHDFRAIAPDRANYSHDREIAREIERYGDPLSAYIIERPGWFNSRAVRVHLGITDPKWNAVISTPSVDQPPLSTLQGTALFVIHPEDQASLATLRQSLPQGAAIPRSYPDGRLSFYAYYGER